MAQYYTLDEAARILQTSPEEMRKIAETKKLRTFRDKGTMRFRAQEVDELAREMGIGSDPDLQLGEVPAPKKGSSPVPAKKPSKIDRPSKLDKSKKEDDVFEFSLSLDEEEEQVQLGILPPASPTGSKSGKKSKSGLASPAPKPGSDSDVRLVPDGLGEPKAPTPPPKKSKPSKLGAPDSGVRIVPPEPSDSDVKMILDPGDDAVQLGGSKASTASDSDIRLEQVPRARKPGSDAGIVTEEIDLDAELGKLGNPTPPPKPSARPSRTMAAQLPTASPFELSEEDLGLDDPPGKATMEKPVTDSSGDFELTPSGEDLSPLELGSDEMPALRMDDDEVSLGSLVSSGGSGINLRDPADSGISLEKDGSDEVDLDDLSLDVGSTPSPKKVEDDSDSEFELSLDDSDASDDDSETLDAESSEFELSLDDSGSSELELDMEPVENAGEDSDSEFELTLDDSGGSSPLDDEDVEDKDIFETDFEVPALEEESGSEAVALDDESTDLETSDFDLAIDEMDVGAEDESGSQVIALDEDEDVDEDGEPKPKRKSKLKGKGKSKLLVADDEDDAESAFADINTGDEDDDADVAAMPGGKVRIEYVEKPPAPWGAVPTILMLPSLIVLIVVGLMGFELIQGMVSYQKTGKFSGLLIRPITEAVTGETLPGGDGKKK